MIMPLQATQEKTLLVRSVRSPHLSHRHSLWGTTVQHNHAIQRHLSALGVLLKILSQICERK